MTYSDLVARLNAFLGDAHETDSDWVTALAGIIEAAELRCYRDLDLLATRKTTIVTLPQGQALLAAPADWLLGQGVRLTVTNAALDRRDPTFLNEYAVSQGVPKYWAEPTAGTLQFAPVPNANVAAELSYHARPAPLSQASPTTWLAANLPDLLFFAAMVQATGYLKNFGAQADDPKMAMSWEQQYQTALATARIEEGRRKGDNAFDSSRAPPPPSNQPQGS